MQPGSTLVSGEPMYSPHSTETWVVHVVESCWSSANLCLLTFQRRDKDLGIRDRRWLTEGNPLGKSGLADEHLVRTDEGVVFARSVRRLAGQRKPPSSCRNTTEAEDDDCGHPACG